MIHLDKQEIFENFMRKRSINANKSLRFVGFVYLRIKYFCKYYFKNVLDPLRYN